MEEKDLKAVAKEAQDAVNSIKDENLRQIAFQKFLEHLLGKGHDKPEAAKNLSEQKKAPNPQTSPSELPENLSEFYVQKGSPGSGPKIVLIMAYFWHFGGKEAFSTGDIIDGYKNLLIPKPANPTDVISQNVRNGYIIKGHKEAGGKQTYHISKFGIDFVNSDFTTKPPQRKNGGRRKAKKIKNTQ